MVEEPKQAEQPTEVDMITKATMAAERLEKATEVMKGLIKTQQEIESRRILGGQSAAGTVVEQPKVETPREYKDRIMRGGI